MKFVRRTNLKGLGLKNVFGKLYYFKFCVIRNLEKRARFSLNNKRKLQYDNEDGL